MTATTALRPSLPGNSASAIDHAGSRERVGALLVEYASEIRQTAARFTKSAADADDLAQEVAARALDFAGHFAPGSNFGAWMRTMLRNLAINRGRYEARRPVAAAAAGIEGVIDSAPARATPDSRESAHDLLADREQISGPLLAAIEQLPAAYRDVLLLWAIGDREYREIAQILDCPVGTVMSRLHRARRLLREALADQIDGNGVLVG